MLSLLLLLQIPVNFGSLWMDPTSMLIPSTWYGQNVRSYPPRILEVDGFRIPYTSDVSFFFSGSFEAQFDFFSAKFKKKIYNVKKPLTILNSERGYGDYAAAGFLFKQLYKSASFSIVADYLTDGFRKFSVTNPCFSYGNFSAYYYRFVQDSSRYFRLFYASYTGNFQLSGMYGESVGEGRHFFSGFSAGRKSGDYSISLMGEFLASGENMGKLNFSYKQLHLGLVKPFFKSRVYPEFEYIYRPGKFLIILKGLSVDSSSEYRAYSLGGIDLGRDLKILAGYGKAYGAGYNNFYAGSVESEILWKNWGFRIAGKYFSDTNASLDSLRLRVKISYTKSFKRENSIKIAGIVDYFGGQSVILSSNLEIMLFRSVFVKVEELNLLLGEYPFEFPENGERLFRILVSARLFD